MKGNVVQKDEGRGAAAPQAHPHFSPQGKAFLYSAGGLKRKGGDQPDTDRPL